jgi:hypothetical protein
VINPRSDAEFAARVTELIDAGVDTPTALEVALRPRHPRVAVRDRGLSNEAAVVWYIYRDGHWVP